VNGINFLSVVIPLSVLPPLWRADFGGIRAEPVTRGMSGAKLWRLQTTPARYLKIAEGAPAASALREEIARTRWLRARGIRVARIVRAHASEHLAAMLTQALPGTPADTIEWPPERLLAVLGRALATLHALPPHACPFDERLPVRLAQARGAVARGEVDAAQFAARNRRRSPRTLLTRLTAARPPRQQIVVAHGDASLSNMLVAPDGRVSFIDCGHAGRADRYLDLAVAGAEIVARFGRARLRLFAKADGLARWNTAKAAYYEDLYEFF
jgi:aminoglycoside 3'-phosphotransferase-2